MIVIIDYGMGNLGSIQNMLRRVGAKNTLVSSQPDAISTAEKIILPGVGAFDTAVDRLRSGGFIELLEHKANIEKVPMLGICLGMQLLFERSEEGGLEGLGWIEGEVRRFNFARNGEGLKIPHMGWNIVVQNKPSPIFVEMFQENRFYFVHSYHAVCQNAEDVLLRTNYGYDFTSAVQRDNIFGVQFHPEKSHKFGKKLLENFARL